MSAETVRDDGSGANSVCVRLSYTRTTFALRMSKCVCVKCVRACLCVGLETGQNQAIMAASGNRLR